MKKQTLPGGIVLEQISAEEAARSAVERKARLGILDENELRALRYPTFFTASMEYFATGEGLTMGVLMAKAASYEDLVKRVGKAFGSYYAQGAEVVEGLKAGATPSTMLPPAVVNIIERHSSGELSTPAFEYEARFHLNRS